MTPTEDLAAILLSIYRDGAAERDASPPGATLVNVADARAGWALEREGTREAMREAAAKVMRLLGLVAVDPDLLTRATNPRDTPTLRADARYLRGLAALGPAEWCEDDVRACQRIAARLDAVADLLVPGEKP